MAWQTNKTDWTPDDPLNAVDMNRIEENIRILGQGNGRAAIASIASATSLAINDADETFFVTGNADIYYIAKGTRQPGNRIQLIFTGGTTKLYHNAGSVPDGYSAIFNWDLGAYVSILHYYTINFIHDGTYWRIVKGL
jgi:hypothetical protein